MNILVVNPIPPEEPSGLHCWVEEAVAALVSAGASVTVVQRQPRMQLPITGPCGQWLSTVAGKLRLEWWPTDMLTPRFLSRQHHALEELIRSRSISKVVVIGIAEVGYVAAAACKLMGVPLCSLLSTEQAAGATI